MSPPTAFVTEIVSVPSGARIEVDGNYVGEAPLRFEWKGPAYREGLFTDGDHTVAAYPAGPGQRAVARGLPGSDPLRGGSPSKIPERVILEVWAPRTAALDSEPPGERLPLPRPSRAERAALVPRNEGADPGAFPVAIAAHPLGAGMGPAPLLLSHPRANPERAVAPESLVPPVGVCAKSHPVRLPVYDASLSGPPTPGRARTVSAAPGALGGSRGRSSLLPEGSLTVAIVLALLLVLARIERLAGQRSHSEGRETGSRDYPPSVDPGPTTPRPAALLREARCLYAIHCGALGLPPDAPLPAVKRRYRELALRYHPDKSRGLGAEERFKRVSQAYREIEALARSLSAGRSVGSGT